MFILHELMYTFVALHYGAIAGLKASFSGLSLAYPIIIVLFFRAGRMF
jgi:hypothetical protein